MTLYSCLLAKLDLPRDFSRIFLTCGGKILSAPVEMPLIDVPELLFARGIVSLLLARGGVSLLSARGEELLLSACGGVRIFRAPGESDKVFLVMI